MLYNVFLKKKIDECELNIRGHLDLYVLCEWWNTTKNQFKDIIVPYFFSLNQSKEILILNFWAFRVFFYHSGKEKKMWPFITYRQQIQIIWWGSMNARLWLWNPLKLLCSTSMEKAVLDFLLWNKKVASRSWNKVAHQNEEWRWSVVIPNMVKSWNWSCNGIIEGEPKRHRKESIVTTAGPWHNWNLLPD